MDELNATRYSTAHVDTLLTSYRGFVEELPELAATWLEMDAMERSHHLALFGQAWGNRHLLGDLFRAGRLTSEQEARLTQLDRQLLERGRLADRCYGLGSRQLLRLFVWGTPLALVQQPVRLDLEPAALSEMALAWAGA
jgi:hypothetical protein